MNRFGAFLVHLGISLAIFGVLAWIVVYHWYPDFFFASDGGWQGIRIIVLVDLVLGPALTLVVFNKRKPRAELRRDLSMIGVFQAVCLVAGTYVVYSERPLALVYVDGQFYSISADEFAAEDVPVDTLDRFPGPFPKRLVVDLPDDLAEQSEVRGRALRAGKRLRFLADYYRPMSYELLDVPGEAIAAEQLRQPGDVDAVEKWLARHGGNPDSYGFFPYAARYGYVFLGVARATGEIVGLLDVTRYGAATAAQDS